MKKFTRDYQWRGIFPWVKQVMQYCWGGKKSKRFSPGSDFVELIFIGELSGMDSAGVLRHGVTEHFIFTPHCWYLTFMFLGFRIFSQSKVLCYFKNLLKIIYIYPSIHVRLYYIRSIVNIGFWNACCCFCSFSAYNY